MDKTPCPPNRADATQRSFQAFRLDFCRQAAYIIEIGLREASPFSANAA
jgi:hypothetical protein